MTNNKYQRCVKDISVETGYHHQKFKTPNVIVVKLSWRKPINEFSYAPKFCELKKIIELLIKEYDEEYVMNELRLK